VDETSTLIVDVRTPEEFRGGAVPEAINIPLDELMNRYQELGENTGREIIVYCASGARSAYAQRMLMQMGYNNVKNGGGLHSMMQRARTAAQPKQETKSVSNEPLIVDVRSSYEFASGAYPGAINIDLDELQSRVNELGSKDRDITLYCASGARSAYAQRMLQQMGFKNVKNGGGLMHMMMRR
jgi:rhodanese-related sulfurtransferase